VSEKTVETVIIIGFRCINPSRRSGMG